MNYKSLWAFLPCLLLCAVGLRGQIHVEDGTILFLQNSSNVFTTGTSTIEGILAGHGTIASSTVTIASTGKISPGSSVGTITVDGNLNLSDGTYVCEVDGTSSFDVINITNGTATIDNANSKLDVTFNFNPSAGNSFQIINPTASNSFGSSNVSITGGNVATVSTNSALMMITALPVELTNLSARRMSEKVELAWHTASETDNAGFEIQRANDANFRQWDKLGFVEGNGTSLFGQAYHFMDEYPLNGVNYYRLKQMDFDGGHEFSYIVSADFSGQKDAFQLYPNPTDGAVSFSLDTDFIGEATFKLFDPTGRLLSQRPFQLEGQPLANQLDLNHLPAGVYFAEIVAGTEKWNQRIVLK